MKKTFRILVPTLLCAAALLSVLTGCGKEEEPAPVRQGGVGLTIDENAGDYVAPAQKAAEAKPGVAIPGWGSFTFPPNTTELEGMVDFYNPEANDGYYYLTYELRLPDDSEQGYEVLYASQLIPPGKHIQTITLNRGLDVGDYEAVIHVQPYTMDESMTPTNNADMKTTLHVQ